MKVDYSERAGRSLDRLTPEVRKAVYKQVKLLEQNWRHLRDDVYYIVDIVPHPK